MGETSQAQGSNNSSQNRYTVSYTRINDKGHPLSSESTVHADTRSDAKSKVRQQVLSNPFNKKVIIGEVRQRD